MERIFLQMFRSCWIYLRDDILSIFNQRVSAVFILKLSHFGKDRTIAKILKLNFFIGNRISRDKSLVY